jgi:glutamate/tyrosine decarboxylase-like PLP-dependent enzyme
MEGDRRHLDGEQAVKLCDENTIGVVAVLGSTFDGSYEPLAEIAAALDGLQAERGLDVPLHVDAASGGFVAPFIQPDIEYTVFEVSRALREHGWQVPAYTAARQPRGRRSAAHRRSQRLRSRHGRHPAGVRSTRTCPSCRRHRRSRGPQGFHL